MYSEILYEVEDPVATITLNRPEALNAWTPVMAAEVRHAVARAEADVAVVGIVITGAGRAFCAGADMKRLRRLSSGGDGMSDVPSAELDATPGDPSFGDDFAGEYTYLMSVPKPIVAAINGPIAGMAVPIALSCDVRFMASDAVLTTAFAQRGLIAEWGISWLLSRLAGPSVALDLLMSARKITGEEAARLGVVNSSVAPGEALAASRDYIRNAAKQSSPSSMAVMKRQVYTETHAGLGVAEAEARRLMGESFGRPDFKEGVASFMEKRAPDFKRLGDSAG